MGKFGIPDSKLVGKAILDNAELIPENRSPENWCIFDCQMTLSEYQLILDAITEFNTKVEGGTSDINTMVINEASNLFRLTAVAKFPKDPKTGLTKRVQETSFDVLTHVQEPTFKVHS